MTIAVKFTPSEAQTNYLRSPHINKQGLSNEISSLTIILLSMAKRFDLEQFEFLNPNSLSDENTDPILSLEVAHPRLQQVNLTIDSLGELNLSFINLDNHQKQEQSLNQPNPLKPIVTAHKTTKTFSNITFQLEILSVISCLLEDRIAQIKNLTQYKPSKSNPSNSPNTENQIPQTQFLQWKSSIEQKMQNLQNLQEQEQQQLA